MVAEAAEPGEGDEPRCRCGHDRRHHMVSAVAVYGGWGKFWVYFMGVSTRPLQIDYRCRVCKEVFATSVDPRDLDRSM